MRQVVILGLLLWIFALSISAGEPPRGLSTEPAPEWDQRFQRTSGWLGADGNYSVRVSPDRVLWFFSDTLVGRIENGHRVDCQMINNSIGVQTATPDGPQLEFFHSSTDAGRAAAIFIPETVGHWYWPVAGVAIDGQVHLLLWEFEKTTDPGVFGFRQTGVTQAVIDNPLDVPTNWKVSRQSLPFFQNDAEVHVQFGSAAMVHGESVYFYGTRQPLGVKHAPRQMLVARVPRDRISEQRSWEFRSEFGWSADFRNATGVTTGVATEYSVTALEKSGGFVLVSHGDLLSPKIEARFSSTPWGPWTPPTEVWTTPEPAAGKKVFTYSGKAHAALSSDDELIVTYAANSFDFGDLFSNPTLYWPRFIKVKLESPLP